MLLLQYFTKSQFLRQLLSCQVVAYFYVRQILVMDSKA